MAGLPASPVPFDHISGVTLRAPPQFF